MAVSPARMRRNVESNLPTVGGAGFGVAAPATLREFADVQNGQPFSLVGQPDTVVGRLTRPSVAWGLGVGTITGLLWGLGAGPSMLQDVYLAHTLTAIPTAAASAAFPVEAMTGGTTTASGQAAGVSMPAERRPSSNGSDFNPAGGQTPDTSPAN